MYTPPSFPLFLRPSSSSFLSASLSFLPSERPAENKQALARYYVLSQLIDRHVFLMTLMQYYSYNLPGRCSDSPRCGCITGMVPAEHGHYRGGVDSLPVCFITLTPMDRLKAMHPAQRLLRLLAGHCCLWACDGEFVSGPLESISVPQGL